MALSLIQFKAKSSQLEQSSSKIHQRKTLIFPWISLSVLSLFKDLRGPLGPKIFSSPLSPLSNTEILCNIRERARNVALLVNAGSSDVAQVVHRSHHSDVFWFCQCLSVLL